MTVTFNKGQQEAYDKLVGFLGNPDEAFFTLKGSAGVGKASPLYEPILTPKGWTTMGQVQEGDLVISEMGLPIKVLDTFEGENLQMYRVTFSDGSYSDCCEDHLWQVRVSKSDKVLSLKNIIKAGVKVNGSVRSGYRFSVPLIKAVNHASEELLLDPYIMGYALGNGHSPSAGKRIQVTCNKLDLHHVKKFIPTDIKVASTASTGRIFMLVEDSHHYNHTYGLHRLKSKDKFIPKSYIMSGKESSRKMLLAGLLDSDGHCLRNPKENRVSYSTVSTQLSQDVASVVRSLGGTATISRGQRNNNLGNYYTVYIRVPFNPFKLNRKRKHYNPSRILTHKKIISAELLGPMPGKCLLVDNPTHLYITKDYTVTHNTFMMSMLEDIPNIGSNLIFTAPTHRAVHALSKRVKYSECITIHKFLGLSVGKKEGKTFLRKNPNSDSTVYADIKIVIADESSMISDQLATYIIKDVQQWGRKYIFVGDICQLPPINVKGGKTPVFDMPSPECRYTLMEIVRQAKDNPIIIAATAIRDAIMNDGETDVRTGVSGELGVQCLKPTPFFEKMKEVITSEDAKTHQDYCRVIAWRNETTRMYNRKCRGFLGKNPDISFDVGDLVMVNEAYCQGESDVVFNTGTELRITSMMEMVHETYPDLECWLVTVEDLSGDPVDAISHGGDAFMVVQDKSQAMYSEILKSLSKQSIANGNWEAYYYFKENLLDVRPVYSITAHKSQGSTFDTVFVDFRDIFKNRKSSEADKCLYTAITRASRKVYVLY